MSEFKFHQFDSVGAAAAEDDELLSETFVDTGHISVLQNVKDPRRIVLGRTGSGKTALLRRLLEIEERVVRVEPETLALEHISNSTILKFLNDIGVRLDVFFKLLWRHVLVVELIKKKLNLNSEKSTEGFFRRIFQSREEREFREALDYLKKWGEKFWETTDYRIKEITSIFEQSVQANIAAVLQDAGAQVGSATKLSEEQKLEVSQRAQKVVNEIQIKELSGVIRLIDRLLDDSQKGYYICIDRLDEDWIEDKLRFRLIRALIETSRDFSKVRQAKVIVAIRQDLLQQVYDVTRDGGFQEEKYESLYLNVRWTRRELTELMNSRIKTLVTRRYTKKPVTLSDILPRKMGRSGTDPIDFILERTLLRPRDAIAFLNYAIPLADGKSALTAKVLKEAEEEYSRSRLKALFDEWHSNHPDLQTVTQLLHGRTHKFRCGELTNDELDEICMELCTDGLSGGSLRRLAQQVYEDKATYISWRSKCVYILYKVGILGVKISSSGRVIYSNDARRHPLSFTIDDRTQVEVHPAFRRALFIKQAK